MKYSSPSTPDVSHNLANFIVEAMLINKYGALPEGGWRKGRSLAGEWGPLLTKVQRVKTLGVSLEQLAWFVQFFKVADLDYKEFGLLRWKIRKYFKWCNVENFVAYYQRLHSVLAEKNKKDDYIEGTVGYKTKQGASGTKTLSDILKELENESRA